MRADEALAIGLVDEVVAPEAVLDRALERAAALAAGATKAQGLAKRAIDRGLDITLNGGLDLEQQLFADVFLTEDAAHRRAIVPRARPRQRHLQGEIAAMSEYLPPPPAGDQPWDHGGPYGYHGRRRCRRCAR